MLHIVSSEYMASFITWKLKMLHFTTFLDKCDKTRVTGFLDLLFLPVGVFLHRHLDIGRVITAENWPLHIGSSRAWTGDLSFPSASC